MWLVFYMKSWWHSGKHDLNIKCWFSFSVSLSACWLLWTVWHQRRPNRETSGYTAAQREKAAKNKITTIKTIRIKLNILYTVSVLVCTTEFWDIKYQHNRNNQSVSDVKRSLLHVSLLYVTSLLRKLLARCFFLLWYFSPYQSISFESFNFRWVSSRPKFCFNLFYQVKYHSKL